MVLRLFKKIIICFLALQLAFFSPISANAASPAGWGFSKYDIAKSLLTATKNGVTVVVSAAPSASTVGSYAIRFAGAAAIAYAVAKYGGSAIDWVLDPANNSVRSKDGAIPGLGGEEFCSGGQCFATPELAGAVACGGAGLDYVRDEPPYYPWFGVTVACKNGELMHIDFKNTNSITVGAAEIGSDLLTKANSGDTSAASVVKDAMADEVNKGVYDTPLDLAKPEEKTCEAGYVKNSAGECVKKDEPKTCPAGSFKVGDICIDPPESKEDGSCGECCEQLLQAISALADLQTVLNQKLLDSDDKTRQELLKIQDKIDLLATDLKDVNNNIVKLVDGAKKLNTTVEKLDENQELRFKNLTDTIKQANKELLDSDKITQEKIDKTNELLTQSLDEFKKTNEKLDKVNENLEKMQKCNETEFNKKVCDFIDWFQDEPTLTDEPKPTIKDIDAESSNKIDMSGSCPAPYQINFSVFGYSQDNSISYQPLCDALEMLKPIFVGAGALSSMFILMGYSRPNSTGVNN